MQPESRGVDGTHSLRLHLLEWSSDGVPLLLLHGFGNDAHIWDDFAPSVAPFYRTLALDHRGHGDSAWDPQRRYDVENLADDVEAVTAQLGIERLVVIGHSLGGRVATLFAGRHPERMAGLVIVDVGPEVDARGRMRIRMDVESRPTPLYASEAEYARDLSLAYPAARPDVLARMAHHGLRRRPDGLLELKMDPALRSNFGAASVTPAEAEAREREMEKAMWQALARISCPTLVVRGAASDILAPDVADRMVEAALPKGQLAVVARAGHSVMTDNPDGFREAVCAFVLS